LLCAAPLHAQSRHISLEGTSFTIKELLEAIDFQSDIQIVNKSLSINRGEVVGGNVTSPEMVRDVVDQVLSGSPFSFYSYDLGEDHSVVTIIGKDRSGSDVQIQITVEMATGQVVAVEITKPEPEARFALKTNLLYGATTTPNVGAEFRLNNRLTLDISTGWNPFVYSNNKKFAHWMIQPTLRYWLQETPFNGHFVGGSLMYSFFNVGGLDLPGNIIPALVNHRFQGDAYSVSLQYGHQWQLSPRWGIETSLNVGYMYLDYQKFECERCGEFIGAETKHYFGPTNASVSLIYTIK
jgi:hypothetical protein